MKSLLKAYNKSTSLNISQKLFCFVNWLYNIVIHKFRNLGNLENKIEVLILIKIDFTTNCLCFIKNYFIMLKMRGLKTDRRRLSKVARGVETVSLNMKGFLRIRRLLRSFRGVHDAPAPPPQNS